MCVVSKSVGWDWQTGPRPNPVCNLFLSIKFYWHLATPVMDTFYYPDCLVPTQQNGVAAIETIQSTKLEGTIWPFTGVY